MKKLIVLTVVASGVMLVLRQGLRHRHDLCEHCGGSMAMCRGNHDVSEAESATHVA